MIWPNTTWIIALMTNKRVWRDLAIMQHPRCSMRSQILFLSVYLNTAISLGINAFNIFPAIISFSDIFPECFDIKNHFNFLAYNWRLVKVAGNGSA